MQLELRLVYYGVVYQFFLIRERESATKQFEAFHRLVKELVEPDEKTNVLYVDRQAAIAFELRHFPRYHAFTLRRLKSFLAKVERDQENLQKHALLLEVFSFCLLFSTIPTATVPLPTSFLLTRVDQERLLHQHWRHPAAHEYIFLHLPG